MDDTMERLPTVETSDADFEKDQVSFVTLESISLGGRGDMSLFVPDGLPSMSNVPIVLLLHGVYGSHWSWFFKGGAHRTALRLIQAGRIRPVVLVAPSDGLWKDGTAYIRHEEHRDYESWICSDVLGYVRQMLPCTGDPPIFIAGLSMGGYGALRLGAKRAPLFRGIAALSAITRLDEMNDFVRAPFPAIDRKDHDILAWIQLNRERLPPIRIDCGREDPLIVGNRRFHRELQQRHIAHDYCESSGMHSWAFWREHISDALLFFEAILTASTAS